MFGPGSMYVNFNWFWLVGAGFPVVIWFLGRKLKIRFASYLHAPIMFGAMGWLPPATPLSFSTWALFGLLFNYYIRKRWNGWWSTYNYVTSAALDAGLILSTIVVFFAITLPGVTIPQWWGNVDVFNTVVSTPYADVVACYTTDPRDADHVGQDASYTAWLKTVPENGTFGPATWK